MELSILDKDLSQGVIQISNHVEHLYWNCPKHFAILFIPVSNSLFKLLTVTSLEHGMCLVSNRPGSFRAYQNVVHSLTFLLSSINQQHHI